LISWTVSFIIARKEKKVSFGVWLNELLYAGVRTIVDNII